jgi:Binding domain of DNA repair protein Ercc1 (rad10/Swi10)
VHCILGEFVIPVAAIVLMRWCLLRACVCLPVSRVYVPSLYLHGVYMPICVYVRMCMPMWIMHIVPALSFSLSHRLHCPLSLSLSLSLCLSLPCSLQYFMLHPKYIFQRMGSLVGKYKTRVLLCHVDVVSRITCVSFVVSNSPSL